MYLLLLNILSLHRSNSQAFWTGAPQALPRASLWVNEVVLVGNSNISAHDVNYTLLVQTVSGIPKKLKPQGFWSSGLSVLLHSALERGWETLSLVFGHWNDSTFDARFVSAAPWTDNLISAAGLFNYPFLVQSSMKIDSFLPNDDRKLAYLGQDQRAQSEEGECLIPTNSRSSPAIPAREHRLRGGPPR